MEVFVRRVPERAREKDLTDSFRECLSNLSIENWLCEKGKKKTFATLTFLSSIDGQRFLSQHGQVKDFSGHDYLPIGRKEVIFQGIKLICTQSNKQPNYFALKSLEMDAKARKTQPVERPKVSTILQCSLISCGRWEYIGSTLFFKSHLDWHVPANIKFDRNAAVVTMENVQSIEMPYSTVQAVTSEGLPRPAITISLTEAPRFFQSSTYGNDLSGNDLSRMLEALLDIHSRKDPAQKRVPGLGNEHEKIAGTCLVYRIGLIDMTFGDQINVLSHIRRLPPIVRSHIDIHIPKERYGTQMSTLIREFTTSYAGLPYAVKFQVQKLAQNGYLSPDSVLAFLPEIAGLHDRSDLTMCVDALCRLVHQIPFAGPETDAEELCLATLASKLKSIEERLRSGDRSRAEARGSENVAIIHRATVTPAGIYLYGPTPESNNRILRKYPKHHDYFVRVQFCDEDGSQVLYRPGASNDLIFHSRFRKVLDEGINIGGRQFSFLGFSHSSLRAQSCWFMAPFVHNGRLLYDRMLIAGLGDFSHIRCAAKCAARIGQAFSETPTAVTIAPGVAKEIQDVKRNGRVFSDGVGTVSKSVLEQIQGSSPAAERQKPTLFQIRYSGAKGMIALDSRIQGDALFLRESMIKFPGSDSTDVEICGAGYKPLPLFLNQQVIKILEDMGVEEDFFLHHQAKEVERLRMTVTSPILASNFLKAQDVGRLVHLPWFFRKLSDMNLSFQDDNFLRDILEITVLIELRALKYKARIPVGEGYTLLGIMDETGIINEGEIFCIVGTEDDPKVITGKDLLITRAPALHPGDIQLVKAVTVPSNSPLMQLRNCICFSQHGSRDLPSQLSGGDLDGDLYQIILDPKARPKRVFMAADYHGDPPIDLGRPVVRSDMTDFFVKFMATDQLRRIATLHKVLADQRTDGVCDLDCVWLAAMHSTAVDFSKSGIPVDMSKMPRYNRYRPDFMAPGPHVAVQKNKPVSFEAGPENESARDEEESSFYKYYESDKILGKLYRAIDERQVFSSVQQLGRFQNAKEKEDKDRHSGSLVLKSVWVYVQQRCQGLQWTHLLDRARGIRDEYEDCLMTITSEYTSQPSRPLSELEVFVGNILGKAGVPSKRQRELVTSMKERFHEDLSYTVNCILQNETQDSVAGRSDEALEMSLACFDVAMETADKATTTARSTSDWRSLPTGQELVSFRYVAAAICLKEMDRMSLLS